MNKRSLLGGCVIMLLAAAPLFAQNSVRSAGEKISGAAYRENSAQAYGSSAYTNAAALDEYARSYSYIPAETAQEHVGEVHRNVTSAKKELSKLDAKAKNNKVLAKHLETIHGHYNKALEHATAVGKESEKNDKADAAKLTTSTKGMTDSLKAAEAEHKKLSEHLKSTDGK